MEVVSDTSPLIYLIWTGFADVLPKLYGRVIIPPEVLEELAAEDAPAIVQTWAKRVPGSAPRRFFVIDERAGTALARGLGLPVTGTLGLLDEAARRKYILLPEAIERLKRTSFRYPKAVVARLLEEDARRQ